jgi:recombination protein RecT
MPGNDLATRVAAAAQRTDGSPPNLKTQISQMGEQFQLAMPRGFDAQQLVRDAFTCLSMTPKLATCDPVSVIGGLMTCAQLGLRPAVLGQAWLLPMWDGRNRTNRATLVIGYKGYLELMHRSGQVEAVNAHIIHEGDKWSAQYGDDERLIHEPNFAERPGPALMYYATGRKRGAARSEFQIAPKWEMEEHRDKFAMAKKNGAVVGPWRDHFDAMALKTMMLRLSKYMPQSPELIMAQIADGGVRLELAPNADITEVTETIDGEVLEDEPVGAPSEPDPWASAPEPWPPVAAPPDEPYEAPADGA